MKDAKFFFDIRNFWNSVQEKTRRLFLDDLSKSVLSPFRHWKTSYLNCSLWYRFPIFHVFLSQCFSDSRLWSRWDSIEIRLVEDGCWIIQIVKNDQNCHVDMSVCNFLNFILSLKIYFYFNMTKEIIRFILNLQKSYLLISYRSVVIYLLVTDNIIGYPYIIGFLYVGYLYS